MRKTIPGDLLTSDQASAAIRWKVSAQMIRLRVRQKQLKGYLIRKSSDNRLKIYVKKSEVLKLYHKLRSPRITHK